MPLVTVAAVAASSAPPAGEAHKERPAHHLNDEGTAFHNPWPSWRPQKALGIAGFVFKTMVHGGPVADKDVEAKVQLQKPTWGKGAPAGAMKATWLGHACFLLELSTPDGAARGPRVLYDPVFSHRCSPSQYFGPARYTNPPCEIETIPAPDIVVISHNHYDHMDTATLQTLNRLHPHLHFFAPLGNDDYFSSIGIPADRFHCLDWWDNRTITADLPNAVETGAPLREEFKLTCTPCQHFTGRGIFDRFRTLWSSWVVESKDVKVFFGGDTAYRAVLDGENEDDVPVCPAFKEIGEKFGGFDLAFIPIGAYEPRHLMSPVHCAPQDSVLLFKDIKAKRAIGMHWGTWVLTCEPILEPPQRLAEACKKVGIPDGAFNTCGLGATVVV